MGKYEPIIKIAEYGSLTKAAQVLGYTQSGISYLINHLEKELGIKIFHRERQGVSLTDAGKALLKIMEKIESLETELSYVARSFQVEVLRVGVITSVSTGWLANILKRFYQQYPETDVYIVQQDTYIDLAVDLQENKIDCCFFAGEHSTSFDFIPLYQDEYFVITSKDHDLADRESVSEGDLYQYPFIFPNEAIGPGPIRNLSLKLSTSSKLFTKAMEDMPTIALVSQGLGISIMPGLLLEQIAKEKDIVAIPFEKKITRTLGILCRPKEETTDVVRAFIKLTKEFLSGWHPKNSWKRYSTISEENP